MASAYPGALDNFTNPDGTGTLAEEGATGDAHHTLHADERDAIDAVQAELGVDPAGGEATVVARLDAIDTTAAIYPAGMFVPASATTKFPGRPEIIPAVIAGGAAGDHTVTGISTFDDIVSVIEFDTGVPADITDEFTISDTNEINNTGGTDTTGNTLMVHYSRSRGYDLTGVTFSQTVQQKAAMSLFAPAAWASVDVNILALATSFGSGTARFFHSDTAANAVDIEVAASYNGVLFEDFTFGAGGGGLAPIQFAQFALTREADHVNDDLAEPLAILAVYLTEGAA